MDGVHYISMQTVVFPSASVGKELVCVHVGGFICLGGGNNC